MRQRKQMHLLEDHCRNMSRLFAEMYRQKTEADLEAWRKQPRYKKLLKKLSYKWFHIKVMVKGWIRRKVRR